MISKGELERLQSEAMNSDNEFARMMIAEREESERLSGWLVLLVWFAFLGFVVIGYLVSRGFFQ